MGDAEGFAHAVRKSGEVVVTHHGRTAAVLRGRAAERFLADLERSDDAQLVMARVTGNYRRGTSAPPRSTSATAGGEADTSGTEIVGAAAGR